MSRRGDISGYRGPAHELSGKRDDHNSDTVRLVLGYSYLFFEAAVIRKEAAGEDRLRGALFGAYESEVDIAGAELAGGSE